MDGFAHNFELPLDATSRDALDGWVRLGLRRSYDAVLTEELSPELAALLSPAPPPDRSHPG